LSTRIGWTAGLHRHTSAYCARNADDFRLLNLSWYAVSLCHHAGLANLTAGRVRHPASTSFLRHRAGGIRNLLRDRLTGPRAGRVRNLLRDRLTGPRAGCVRNLFANRLAGPRASGVWDLLRDAVLFVADARVRNLLHARDRNSAADRVRLLAMTHFLNHPGTADCSHFGARHPAFTADCPCRLAATRAGR
jgi:hypothetical protein